MLSLNSRLIFSKLKYFRLEITRKYTAEQCIQETDRVGNKQFLQIPLFCIIYILQEIYLQKIKKTDFEKKSGSLN